MLIKVNKTQNDNKYEVETLDSENIELQTKTATENGDVEPDEGYYGLSKVSVNVPATSTPILGTTTVPCFKYSDQVVIAYDENNNFISEKNDVLNAKAITFFAAYNIKNCYIGTSPFVDGNTPEETLRFFVDEDELKYETTDNYDYSIVSSWSSFEAVNLRFCDIAGYQRYS